MAWCSIHYREQAWDSFPDALDVWVNLTDVCQGLDRIEPADAFPEDLVGRDITAHLSVADRRKLYALMRGLQLGFVVEPAMGCDGSDHELTIAFAPLCSVSCRWWVELPAEWSGLEEILRIVRKGAKAASRGGA